MIGRNDLCWCGSKKKWKSCHYPEMGQQNPKLSDLKALYKKKYGILIKTPLQIEGVKKACRITAEILEKTCAFAKEGVTTNQLNSYAEQLHKEAKVTAAPLGYGEPPFPKSICTSLNEVICHGIPDDIPLKNGDIVNIDLSCIVDGYFGDCSKMVMIGEVSTERKLVVETSYECLMLSIEPLKPGLPVSIIGEIIEKHAHQKGCSVVNQFVGHGVGVEFHEPPQIPHFKNNLSIPLLPGMIFTIEPMINAGVREAIVDKKDEWTARTRDGKASAQWEHTILITEKGHEILTPWTL